LKNDFTNIVARSNYTVLNLIRITEVTEKNKEEKRDTYRNKSLGTNKENSSTSTRGKGLREKLLYYKHKDGRGTGSPKRSRSPDR